MSDASALETIQDEAAGVLRLYILIPDDVATLMDAFLSGDPEAARLVTAVLDSITRVRSAPRRQPMLCAVCPRPLRRAEFRVGVAMPERDDPTRALGFGFCERCAAQRDTLPAKAVQMLREIWPDGRLVQYHEHPAGHA